MIGACDVLTMTLVDATPMSSSRDLSPSGDRLTVLTLRTAAISVMTALIATIAAAVRRRLSGLVRTGIPAAGGDKRRSLDAASARDATQVDDRRGVAHDAVDVEIGVNRDDHGDVGGREHVLEWPRLQPEPGERRHEGIVV